jgi:predicted membrane-bound dolichyl-phosphate-mannose-protein mannosyltransferase
VPPDSAYATASAGRDPNGEHPPLGKVLIAGSMRLFGDGALGWRLPSILAGLASIALVYRVTRAGGGSRSTALLAASLLAFDNLALGLGRLATLDMPLLTLLLLGAWCMVRGWPLGAGAAFALAALVKVTGAAGLLAMLLFVAGRIAWQKPGRTEWLRRVGLEVGPAITMFGCVWLGGLWLMDQQVSVFGTPWDHLAYIFRAGLSLRSGADPTGADSAPWQWLVNDGQMTYVRADPEPGGRLSVVFRAAMNPLLIGVAPLALGYAMWRAYRAHDVLSLWLLTWAAAMFLPFLAASLLAHRLSYISYFLPTVPALAVAVARLVRAQPSVARWTYLLAVLLGFFAYFPFQLRLT